MNGVPILPRFAWMLYLLIYKHVFRGIHIFIGLRFRPGTFLGKAVVGGGGLEARVWRPGYVLLVAFCIDLPPMHTYRTRHLMID